MDEKPQKYNSLLDRMKKRAQSEKIYGTSEGTMPEQPSLGAGACVNCGAPRAQKDGLTHCGYCGHEFISTELSDGIHIKKEDNSRDVFLKKNSEGRSR